MCRFIAHCVVALFVIATPLIARSEPQSPKAIHFSRFQGYLEVGALYKNERRTRQGSTAFKIEQLDVDQLLHLDTAGSVYHPRFLEFLGSFELNTKQEVIDNGQGTRFPVEGNLRLDFLKQHPYGVTMFGKISQSELERPFTRTIRYLDSIYGTSLHYRPDPVSLDLTYRRRSRVSSGNSTNLDESGDDFTASGRYRAGKLSQGDFEFGYTDEIVQNRGIQRLTARASNITFLDEKKRIRSSTRGRVRDQSDAGDTFTASLASDLDWRHTDRLRSRYRVDYRRNEITRPGARTSSVDSVNVGASIEHRLYDSLNSRFNVAANIQDATASTTRRYEATLSENYKKKLGDWGRLKLNLRPGIDFQERRTTSDTGDAINEPQVLTGVDPVTLARLDIDLGSIVVTDASGTFLFVEGFDYEITPRGRSTELRRLLGGNISDGQSVLVSYSFSLGGSGDILTQRFGSFAEISIWNTAALYGRFDKTDQNRVAGDLDIRLESLERSVVGSRVDLSWSSGSIEWERQRSTFTSYDSLSQSLEFFTPTTSGWRARLTGRHSRIEYTDTNQKVRRITALASLMMQVGRRGTLEIEGDYQRERWSGELLTSNNDLDAYGLATEFKWRIRRVEISLAGRIRQTETRGEKDLRQRIDLRVRREF